ncbi:hypothetical protein [Candidatus Enterococcus ferrettii]|uniref:Polysaccharide deacetylase n=1 Tax=Candidatus Enterococcus ferrettii TaxID=2815324 RepID=A0ABV0ELS8_9ENTE|nr:hypothetical protein [Enterococcus sp. 665A]MBO1341812.1 hypothetical protein [Enterococcus sp. 665A]
MKKRQKVVVYGLILAILLATGISIKMGLSNRSEEQSEPPVQNTVSPLTEKEEEQLKQADSLAMQYDYDGAIKLLQGQDFTGVEERLLDYKLRKNETIMWSDPALFSHLSMQPLVPLPEKAFSSTGTVDYQGNHVTTDEFERLLNELYERNYVLVRLSDIVKKTNDGTWQFVGVALPEGKKPLILSQENVSYNEENSEAGLSSKLVVDKDNRVKSCYRAGENELAGNYDMVPLVDQFVWKHPDFSYRGSKGALAVTGADGVFGYKVSAKKNTKEKQRAKAVADRLKETGWTLASYSWAPINFDHSSLAMIQADTIKYQEEVESIIGETPLLLFPAGSDIGTWQPYNEYNQAYLYLKDAGFSVFSQQNATQESWGEFTPEYYRNSRIMVTGTALENGHSSLTPFMDVADVIDKEVRGFP